MRWPITTGLGLGKRLMTHCAVRVAYGMARQALFLLVLDGNTEARAFDQVLGGEESACFEDPFPAPTSMVPILPGDVGRRGRAAAPADGQLRG